MVTIDCCMATSLTAAACYAHNVLGRHEVPMVANGTATLTIDSWSVNITLAEQTMQLLVAEEDSFMGFTPGEFPEGFNFNCSDFVFT